MFVSRKDKEPNQNVFERRSIKCGIFPEIVVYDRNPFNNETLEGDYYVGVFGYVQSTFSLVYYVETEGGHVSKVKLMTGQKQRGVLSTTE